MSSPSKSAAWISRASSGHRLASEMCTGPMSAEVTQGSCGVGGGSSDVPQTLTWVERSEPPEIGWSPGLSAQVAAVDSAVAVDDDHPRIRQVVVVTEDRAQHRCRPGAVRVGGPVVIG